MTRRQLLQIALVLVTGRAPIRTPIVIPRRVMYARVTVTASDLAADPPPPISWFGLPAADWVNDATYRSEYLGIPR